MEMNINWYPGHMAKTRRLLIDNLKLVDVVIELLDARVPYSSQNPEFDKIFNNKKRVKVFNKYDLSDPHISNQWKLFFEKQGIPCIFINSKTGSGFKILLTEIEKQLAEKFEHDRKRGIQRRPVRAMVVGIPNVGKSTFINRLTGRSSARTGDRPGVTKDKQWIKVNKNIHLLDTPGILWPKFEDKQIGLNLALSGAIKDEIMDLQGLSYKLIEFLTCNYNSNFEFRYSIATSGKKPYEILNEIALKRGFLIEMGKPDTLKASQVLLDEFRGAVIGKISLEKPELS